MSRDWKPAHRAIRKILWEDWDPIGCGVPQDEYDDYVWPVYRLLIDGKSREEVHAYLLETAAVTIGSPPRTPEAKANLERAVDKLAALDVTGENS